MTKTKVGRPRSEKAQEAVLEATHALLQENGGSGLTIEAIARRAKVGKPTIYRWWPSMADIVLEVLLHQAEADITVPAFTSLDETLRAFLRLSMKAIGQGAGAHLRFLMAHAQQDDDFRERFRENFTLKRRAALDSIFVKARDRGQIDSDQDTDILVDIVFGAMWYRLLTGHAPLDQHFADALTKTVLALTRPNPL